LPENGCVISLPITERLIDCGSWLTPAQSAAMAQSSALLRHCLGRLMRQSRSYSAAPHAAAAAAAASSWFGSVRLAENDPILGITERFLADQHPHKLNVGVVSAPAARQPASRPAGASSRGASSIRPCRGVPRDRAPHRARTATTTASRWCWSACARRRSASWAARSWSEPPGTHAACHPVTGWRWARQANRQCSRM
jgi:hypothetical protein